MSELKIIQEAVVEERKQPYIDQCSENTLIDYVASDFEIPFPKGYSIQFSASLEKTFAKSYGPCNVSPLNEFEEKDSFEYDFSFQGDVRFPFRYRVFKLMNLYIPGRKNLKFKFDFNIKHFSQFTEEEKKEINERIQYEHCMKNSRFCIAPRGAGIQSIRFFEALAVSTIPIYMGPKETKFPLDWIIDWDKACFRIDNTVSMNGEYMRVFDNLMRIPIDQLNERRKYIFEIYNKYLRNSEIEKEETYKEIRRIHAEETKTAVPQ